MHKLTVFEGVTDLYLGETGFYASGPAMSGLAPVNMAAPEHERASQLRELCESRLKEHGNREFSIRHEGVSWRVSVLESTIETVFVLRRFPDRSPDLNDLAMHPALRERLLRERLTGLILVTGAFGNGKTTTASAIVKTRLDLHPGVAVTIEDPPEMPLEGRHQRGVCYQTWARDGDFAQGVKAAARWAPSMIYLGEIRDGEAAMEALKAAINGVLVIATMHASDVAEALERLHILASHGQNVESLSISSLMASGLRCLLWQELLGESDAKRLSVQMLWVDDDDLTLKAKIRDQAWHQMPGEVKVQMGRIRAGLG